MIVPYVFYLLGFFVHLFLGKRHPPVKDETEHKWTVTNFSIHQEYKKEKNTAVLLQ